MYGVWPKSWLKQLRTIAAITKHERPDILHTNQPRIGSLCQIIGRWYRTSRIIYTAHSRPIRDESTVYKQLKQILLWHLAILGSHHTIVPSPTLLQTLQQGLIKQKLKLIPLGRTIGVMYSKEEARQQLTTISGISTLPTKKNTHWIGTVSTLKPEKNIYSLIAATKKLLSIHTRTILVIIGDGPEYAKLQQHVDSLHLSNHIFFLGKIPEAARFLHAFDTFILPITDGDHSYTLQEAGLARLPVVAVTEGTTSPLLINRETGLVVSTKNPTALTEALHTALTDRALTEKLRHNLKEKVQPYSTEKMVAATAALYTITSSIAKK